MEDTLKKQAEQQRQKLLNGTPEEKDEFLKNILESIVSFRIDKIFNIDGTTKFYIYGMHDKKLELLSMFGGHNMEDICLNIVDSYEKAEYIIQGLIKFKQQTKE